MDNTDLRYERTHTAIGQAVTEKLFPALIAEANIGRLAHAAMAHDPERKRNLKTKRFAMKLPKNRARFILNTVVETLANESGYKASEILKAAVLIAEQLEAA